MRNRFLAASISLLLLTCRGGSAAVPTLPARILRTAGIADMARFSPDGKLLAIVTEAHSGTSDETHSVELWDTATWQRRGILKAGGLSFYFTPNSRTLFCRSPSRVSQWDLSANQFVTTYKSSGDFFAVSQDRRFFASRASLAEEQSALPYPKQGTSQVRIWDTVRQRSIAAITLPEPFAWTSGVFSPDNSVLAIDCGAEGGSLTLWNTKTGSEITSLGSSALGIEQSAFSPDGALFAAAGAGLPLTFWDTSTWRLIRRCPVPLKWADEMEFSPTGKRLFLSGDEGTGTRDQGYTVTLWDASAGKIIQQIPYQYGAEFSDDGSFLLTQGRKSVTLWNAVTGKKAAEYRTQSSFLLPAVISPDNRALATPEQGENAVEVWNIPG